MHATLRAITALFSWALIVCLTNACKTEDIDPVVSISIERLRNERISENGGVALIKATLNGRSQKEVRLTLSLGGTALEGVDFTSSDLKIVIPAGDTSGMVQLTALDDNVVDGDRSIIITISAVSNATNQSFGSETILISDDDLDTDGDGISDAADLCPEDSGSVATNGCPPGFGLVLNEVLYDPSNAFLNGDANGDGIYTQAHDEYIELYNNIADSQNISGYTVSDFDIATGTATVRYTFPANTNLAAGKALVLFGGGIPTGSFGGATVFVCSTTAGLSLGNSGERLLIKDAQGNLLITYDTDILSDNPDESYTRNPDITGSFAQHSSVISGVLFSPGTRNNGAPF
jgi:hypothetical protein